MYTCKIEFYDLEDKEWLIENYEFKEFIEVITFIDFMQDRYDVKKWYVENV